MQTNVQFPMTGTICLTFSWNDSDREGQTRIVLTYGMFAPFLWSDGGT